MSEIQTGLRAVPIFVAGNLRFQRVMQDLAALLHHKPVLEYIRSESGQQTFQDLLYCLFLLNGSDSMRRAIRHHVEYEPRDWAAPCTVEVISFPSPPLFNKSPPICLSLPYWILTFLGLPSFLDYACLGIGDDNADIMRCSWMYVISRQGECIFAALFVLCWCNRKDSSLSTISWPSGQLGELQLWATWGDRVENIACRWPWWGRSLHRSLPLFILPRMTQKKHFFRKNRWACLRLFALCTHPYN